MTVSPASNQTCRAIGWMIYTLACFWLALALVWWLLARVDYLYPVWYEVLAIDEHIATYAPQNPAKKGFEQLAPEQHHRAFAQICSSVHTGKPELDDITYPGPAGRAVALLTPDEKTHLRDVRRLFQRATLATALVGLLWLPMAWMVGRLGRPSPRFAAMSVFGTVTLVSAGVALLGPTRVFYQIHIWIFPPEHPWFFYWQDSLMSTLMKAPVLFGGIAGVLAPAALLLSIPVYRTGLGLTGRFTEARAERKLHD